MDKLLKALSHPTRRKILRYIGSHGEASYSELAMIEPKSGVLYHHLKLLGDLIYQDDRRIYKLTEKGYKALSFLEDFFEPKEESIHKVLTPRWLFERIEGRKVMAFLLSLYLITSLSWLLNQNYVLFFVLALPYKKPLVPPFFIALLSWLGSSFLLSIFVRIIYDRYLDMFRFLILNTIPFMLINLSPLIVFYLKDGILTIVMLAVIQLYALLLIISNVSISARITLKKSVTTVIAIHYLSLLVYLLLDFLAYR